MDHQQLDPYKEVAPQKHSSLPFVWDRRKDSHGVFLHVRQLAETECVAFCLDPPRHQRLDKTICLWRIVEDGEEDGRYSQASTRCHEALQRHMPIFGNPLWVPTLDRFSKHSGYGIGGVRSSASIRVGQISKLMLTDDIGSHPNDGRLTNVVFQMEDWRLPDAQIPQRRLVLLPSSVQEVIRESCKILFMELTICITYSEDHVFHLQALLRNEVLDDPRRCPLRICGLARNLAFQANRMVCGQAILELVFVNVYQHLCLFLVTFLSLFHC
mmetsp:Transcript_89047/g.154219  ORF Transcript_89047/g.154219 Transcript_89047/m.154219 type:complete len:270 (-) Transcript_89047:1606-2415(-)